MPDNDYREGIVGEGEGVILGGDLIIRFHGVGGLDVHLFPPFDVMKSISLAVCTGLPDMFLSRE